MKLAVILFNLGGPSAPEEIEPFLYNLFSDPAILSLPGFIRLPLAKLIAKRRAPVARAIYAKIGGRSPILPETEAQARALEQALAARGHDARAFIAMRCSKPGAREAAEAAKAWGPNRIVLLPLYPQYSTTTTASSLADWRDWAAKAGLTVPQSGICCYPEDDGFIAAMAAAIAKAREGARSDLSYRLLLSAHGLPERVIAKGDPYRAQVERSAAAIAAAIGEPGLDWQGCFQSRGGPMKWIGPATDAEIVRAGADSKGVIVAPIAFVSEHSETLVELDIEYRALAERSGVPDYRRASTVGCDPRFIAGLARLVEQALAHGGVSGPGGTRLCPAGTDACGFVAGGFEGGQFLGDRP